MEQQREMALLQGLRGPQSVPEELLEICKDKLDAIRLCIQLSRLPQSVLRDELGIDKGHWTRMMQGQANFPTRLEPDLMYLAGNIAPLQYVAKHMGYELQEVSKELRIRELEQELAKLKNAA